jgi:transcriptional regulator with XRE-family HTH domain
MRYHRAAMKSLATTRFGKHSASWSAAHQPCALHPEESIEVSSAQAEELPTTAPAWHLPAQLAALVRADAVDLADVDIDGAEGTGGDTGIACRAEVTAVLRRTIGGRIAEARNANGWSQGEFAHAMGFANSTQVCLWEAGKRLPPLPMLLHAARVLGVSVDYLTAESDEFERDAKLAARSAVFRRVERLLRHNAETVAQCLLDSCASSGADELRIARFATRARSLCEAINRFRDLNGELFDEARGGATLLRTSGEMQESLGRVERFLTRSAHSRSHAVSTARDLTLARSANRHLEPTFK